MSNVARVASTAANTLAVPPNIEEAFHTHLYTGDGSTNRDIVNNLDILGDGGLLWFRSRSSGQDHVLFDTVRGGNQRISTNSTNENTNSDWITFQENGYKIKAGTTQINANTYDYVNWGFKVTPKFFDIQTWSGDDTTGRVINHNLGCQAGFVLIKDIVGAGTDWIAAHHSEPTKVGYMNTGTFFVADYINSLNSSSFTLGNTVVNSTGRDYIAYIFAHNDGDGGFGPTGDKDVIKCGTYTGSGGAGNKINIGFEPQFLITKKYSTNGNWTMWDNMRGVGGNGDYYLYPHSNLAEGNLDSSNINRVDFSPTGFILQDNDSDTNSSSSTFFYIAIRRGDMAVPTSATEVFNIAARTGESGNANGAFQSGFITDMALEKQYNTNDNWELVTRNLQGSSLRTNGTNAEDTGSGGAQFQYMDGWSTGGAFSASYAWMWKRAPQYFDIVNFENLSGGTNVTHNLDAVPEMIWVKSTSNVQNWYVYHKDVGSSGYLILNDGLAATTSDNAVWNGSDPTSTYFTIGGYLASFDYIAFLFSSLAGISKVGSYTGDDDTSGQTIDCGFTSGARFVLVKSRTANRPWYIWDSTRGIVQGGNDPHLVLNTSAGQDSSFDDIEPHNSGFKIRQGATNSNKLNEGYIFYAIA